MTSHRLGENIFTKYMSDIALKNKPSVLKIEKKILDRCLNKETIEKRKTNM